MSDTFLITKKEEDCCGCRACEKVCPVHAIEMLENEEGFIYPSIKINKCINCNKCILACPMNKPFQKKYERKIYAVQDRNSYKVLEASSGGAFGRIAEYVIDNNGIVFGCMFSKNFKAVIGTITTIEDLVKVKGSKYVFSDTENSFIEAECLLKKGILVLYSGTPCQIAGLKSYLNKYYSNLITVDILCHGVPSPLFLDKYIKNEEDKHKAKLKKIKFRDKSKYGWGKHCELCYDNGKVIHQYGELNSYLRAFFELKINRLNCYQCKFVGNNKKSDITIGDFWGIEKNSKIFSKQELGVSIVVINSNKGNDLFEKIKGNFVYEARIFKNSAKGNPSLIEESRNEKISKDRNKIYKDLNNFGYKFVEKKYLIPKKIWKYKLIAILPKNMAKFLKKLKGRM